MTPRQVRGTGQKIDASAKLEKKVLGPEGGIIKQKESGGMTQAASIAFFVIERSLWSIVIC
jgi:hypothetical protein